MGFSRGLFLLSLGLCCFVACSGGVKQEGDDYKMSLYENSFINNDKGYQKLKALEREMTDFKNALVGNSLNPKDRTKIEKKLKDAIKSHDKHLKSYRVSFQDHEELMESLQKMYESDVNELRGEIGQAQKEQSRAIDAIAINQVGYRPFPTPYTKEIASLQSDIEHLTGRSEKTEITQGLQKARTALNAILEKMFQESKLSNIIAVNDLEEKHGEKEKEAFRVRDQQHERRERLLKKYKESRSLQDYDDVIQSLKQTKYDMENTDKNLQKLAKQSAYIKGICKVKNLIDKCTDAIRDANKNKSEEKPKLEASWLAMEQAMEGTTPQQMKRESEGLSKESESSSKSKEVEPENSTAGSEMETSEEVSELPFELDPYNKGQRLQQRIRDYGSLYNDRHEVFRMRLGTLILKGLNRVQTRLPVPLPGCSISGLMRIRNNLAQWAQEVKYVCRLEKNLRKEDRATVLTRFCLGALASMRDSLYAMAGGKIDRTGLEDDEEKTESMEKFDEQEVDLKQKFEYVKKKLMTLKISYKFSDEYLKEIRSNFIFVKKAPDVLREKSERLLKELQKSPTEEKLAVYLREFKNVVGGLRTAKKSLKELFDIITSLVRSTFEDQVGKYHSAFQRYKQCMVGLLEKYPKMLQAFNY